MVVSKKVPNFASSFRKKDRVNNRLPYFKRWLNLSFRIMNNKVFTYNFAVNCSYTSFTKVIAIFSSKEKAKKTIREEAEERFNILREKGFIMYKNIDCVSLENPESGDYEKFFIEEWEVK